MLRATAARYNKGLPKWEAKALPAQRGSTLVMMATYQFEHEKFLHRQTESAQRATHAYIRSLNLSKEAKVNLEWAILEGSRNAERYARNAGELWLLMAALEQFASGAATGMLVREHLQNAFESKSFDEPLVQRLLRDDVLNMAAPSNVVIKRMAEHKQRNSGSRNKPRNDTNGRNKNKKKNGGGDYNARDKNNADAGKGKWCKWGHNCRTKNCIFEFHAEKPKGADKGDGQKQ